MKLLSLSTYYLFGRCVFGLALLVPFQITGQFIVQPTLLYILIAFIIAAGVRLLATSKQISYPDFLVDITFISAMIFLSQRTESYLSLLLLFPVFFASLLIGGSYIFIFPTIAVTLYSIVYMNHAAIMSNDGMLNIALHALSFFLITLAGDTVKKRLETQGKYIARLEEERARMQGFERLYRVSADLAHELRNPLASISASVQFLREGSRDQELLDILEVETRRLSQLVNDFLLYARPADAPAESVDLSESLKAIIAHLSHPGAVTSDLNPVFVLANRTFVDAALQNILINAIESGASQVLVRAGHLNEKVPHEKSVTSYVCVEIEDNGPGISPEIMETLFEPFVTTKPHGTGLGLAIANRIITGFGGVIYVEPSSFGGAKFVVLLPTIK